MSSLTAPTAATLLPLAFEHDGSGLPTFTSLLSDRKGTTIEAKREPTSGAGVRGLLSLIVITGGFLYDPS